MSTSSPLLVVRDLSTEFPSSTGPRRVVNQVSFEVGHGEVVSLVGESGSGKSLTALSIMRLIAPPGQITGGQVTLDEIDVGRLNETGLQRLRGGEIGMIFQEPMSSMNPVFTIGRQLIETLRAHESLSRRQAFDQAADWLGRVGLPRPTALMASYPHELSGGMLQRAMIAMALCCAPKLLIADEPTTALDVTIQAQILDLLLSLRDAEGLAILFITHDLGVVAQVADSVLVMYDGRIIERGSVYDVFDAPQHPYTGALLATKPMLGARLARLPTISDEVRELARQPHVPSSS